MQKHRNYSTKARIRLDPHNHYEAIRDIERRHMEDNAEEGEVEEQLENEDNLELEDVVPSDIPDGPDIGRIDISFPETIDDFKDSELCYPPSYYTLSPKERLLLLYAENFRHQFALNNHKSRPLVLAPPNECNVQKFVCTTIRPTSFLNIDLRSIEGIASFVADFIIYEPFDDTIHFPNRLISPATILKRRRGNSFEMSTLLCSMLIGAGIDAVVVSGVARTEVVDNDQRAILYPSNIYNFEEEPETDVEPAAKNRFSLGAMPDLQSQLENNIAKIVKKKEDQKQRKEALKREQEELEQRDADRYRFRRPHAWVAVIKSSSFDKNSEIDGDDNALEAISVDFIETSNGFYRSSSCMEYTIVDSVWNHRQYYVNKQKYVRIGEIRWDLQNTKDWERLLPGEQVMENMPENLDDVMQEKHLNTIPSWVSKLLIGEKEYEEKFPHLEKTVLYKKVKHQRFSPYFNRDGKVTQLTLFDDDDYTKPLVDWIYFENRTDMLLQIKKNHRKAEVEEIFGNGRKDNLKCIRSNVDPSKLKELFFFSTVRRDSMEYLKVENDRIIVKSKDRRDLCFYQEFEFKPGGEHLKKIIQKFSRNNSIPASKDIAERTFLITQQKILLKFQYAPGALIASTCEITKPPKPDYGLEIIYDQSMVKTFKANNDEPDPLQLEMYRLMMDQLNSEEIAKRYFKKLTEEINLIFDNRKNEMENPVLSFRLFDSMRNGAARSQRLKQEEASVSCKS
ncbi:coiled-coil domain-containing protein lobo isoform X1 [Stomoxys calcitrans]|uniref:Dynein regulatory complex subunit 7 n=1 Tax=Stomoxys calcitrans TaxID=35570 RepID=A0A1I8PFK6_STOCA|nr:coiled-coil domain-containing protein lobo isoform X1 [Stomoxys calcitrans]